MQNRKIKTGRGGVKRNVFHNIFERIISLDNLFLAWDEFKRGKRKKRDVQLFEYNLEDNIFKLYQELKDKSYKHSHYTSFYIKDPKLRHIHKACVKDRVLHHAVFRILYPLFDSLFISDSYSCRLNKGTHKAVDRLKLFARKVSKNNTKNCFVLKCDIKKFFDSVDHNILLSQIEKRVKDKNAIWLTEEIVRSFPKDRGVPIGNLTSQLFANIYLNELDYFVKHDLRIKYYIRYCDDFLILKDNIEELNEILLKIKDFLRNKLKLSLHSGKISIRAYHRGTDFLGYVSFPFYRVLRTKTKKRMLRRVEEKKNKESFNQTLQSYFGILKHCQGYKLRKEIENEYKS